jgi:hypothetical protein
VDPVSRFLSQILRKRQEIVRIQQKIADDPENLTMAEAQTLMDYAIDMMKEDMRERGGEHAGN